MIPLHTIYERLLAHMQSITLADRERPDELPTRGVRGERKADGRRWHIEHLRSEPQLTTARMTNWQRSQWARAGYPINRVKEFAAMPRRQMERAA